MIYPQMPHKPAGRAASAGLTALTASALLAWGGASAAAAPHTGGRTTGGHAGPGGIISTVAGGVGGPGPATGIGLVSVNAPSLACGSPPADSDVTVAAGRLYIADASVRQVDTRTDILTTPAGTGAAGPFAAGGPAVRASIVACGIAVDHARTW